MILARHSKRASALRRSPILGLMLVGLLALVGSGAPGAWASPAQEEYRLQIPSAGGDGGSTSPNRARSLLGGDAGSPSPSGGGGGFSTDRSFGGPRSLTSGALGPVRPSGSSNGEELLAKARESTGSGLLSAGASAAWKAPLSLAVAGMLLLITLAALLAARRSGRLSSS